MDELQFRRSIYEDPHSTDEDILNAKASDPSKQKFAKEIQQLDDKILNALKVPVPDDMVQKLILRQALESHQQQKKKKRVHLALAASVAFAMGLTLNFMNFSTAYTTVGDYAFAHTEFEASHFSNADEAKVSLASLNKKMAAFHGNFSDNLGQLIFADYCRFDGMKSLHLVFKGETSPVNVFILPNDVDIAFTNSFSNQQLNGKSMQFKDANIIVVGDKSEALDKWQDNIKSNVTWSI
ncbi:DUF3379 family protein [Pseudocolwellia sp. AS88]|jgi:hypothetical protein|uniref:DUF3379 family protein n=1 Tax=Pseudocolwellia sp. AS88 TaxID=3063958 RepID=UPI0026ED3BE9|nr:DUF3379 family protein [Pseudocolwellia sp. AS88]MDO7085697.1 DUF3379 family protein [Pseudocolwellia sp. AS88]